MSYTVKVGDTVTKTVKGLRKNVKDAIEKRFDEIGENPRSGTLLDTSSDVELRGLKHGPFRIYFTIEDKFIVISGIEHEGEVEVPETSKKNDRHNRKTGKTDHEDETLLPLTLLTLTILSILLALLAVMPE